MNPYETLVAANDLSDYQYHLMVNSAGGYGGRVGVSGARVLGVLITKPESGEHCAIKYAGVTKCKAGATVTAGEDLMSTASATATAVLSGFYAIGTALTSAASGGLFDLLITHAGYKGY